MEEHVAQGIRNEKGKITEMESYRRRHRRRRDLALQKLRNIGCSWGGGGDLGRRSIHKPQHSQKNGEKKNKKLKTDTELLNEPPPKNSWGVRFGYALLHCSLFGRKLEISNVQHVGRSSWPVISCVGYRYGGHTERDWCLRPRRNGVRDVW